MFVGCVLPPSSPLRSGGSSVFFVKGHQLLYSTRPKANTYTVYAFKTWANGPRLMLVLQTAPGKVRSYKASMPEMYIVRSEMQLRQVSDKMERMANEKNPNHGSVVRYELDNTLERQFSGCWWPSGPRVLWIRSIVACRIRRPTISLCT